MVGGVQAEVRVGGRQKVVSVQAKAGKEAISRQENNLCPDRD